MEITKKSNRVHVIGKIGKIEYEYKSHSEKFYKAMIKIKRLSGEVDTLPVILSEAFLKAIKPDMTIEIFGEYRSRNIHMKDGKSKLDLYIFAQEVYTDTDGIDNLNEICLDGYFCKQPMYRLTPLGREITDISLAVNINHHKSAYIPCIAWNRNANVTKYMQIGTHVSIKGRIQSREYSKNDEIMTAYEVSIFKINEVEDIPSERLRL